MTRQEPATTIHAWRPPSGKSFGLEAEGLGAGVSSEELSSGGCCFSLSIIEVVLVARGMIEDESKFVVPGSVRVDL